MTANVPATHALPIFSIRKLALPSVAPLLYRWLTEERARFWGMCDKSETEIEQIYAALISSEYASVWIGCEGTEPAFLLECYDPASEQVGDHYRVEDGDVGM